jgi:hypothetical protein
MIMMNVVKRRRAIAAAVAAVVLAGVAGAAGIATTTRFAGANGSTVLDDCGSRVRSYAQRDGDQSFVDAAPPSNPVVTGDAAAAAVEHVFRSDLRTNQGLSYCVAFGLYTNAERHVGDASSPLEFEAHPVWAVYVNGVHLMPHGDPNPPPQAEHNTIIYYVDAVRLQPNGAPWAFAGYS